MIIVQLAGGMGNQMFQYATGRGYQKNVDEKIVLDTHLLLDYVEADVEKITFRPYSLDIFENLKAEKIDPSLANTIFGEGFKDKIRKKWFRFNTTYVNQKGMQPIEIPERLKKNFYFQGNFQSELHFKKIRNELLEEFNFPELDERNKVSMQTILNTENAVSIHVRRGDYFSSINKKIFASVNLQYYHNSVTTLRTRLGLDVLDTFVFTDDAAWANENFKNEKLRINIIEGNVGNNSWKDMCLMSRCKHHIIANSSFSWWGAWLSKSQGFKFAPRFWYVPNTETFDINDIVPSNWSIVDYDLN